MSASGGRAAEKGMQSKSMQSKSMQSKSADGEGSAAHVKQGGKSCAVVWT
jgi:hypothetical protein